MTALRFAIMFVVLGGCMRIYSDSELPDVEVEWYTGDCRDETPDIQIVLVNLDSGVHIERVVACTDERLTIEDVPRARYRVDGTLLRADGSAFTVATTEVDLRNGFDGDAYLYFGAAAYFRVAWVFDMGASCASLQAIFVAIDFESPTSGPDTYVTQCAAGSYLGYPFGDTVSVQLRAESSGGTVAISERTPPITLMPPDLTDVGTLTLTPCGDTCP